MQSKEKIIEKSIVLRDSKSNYVLAKGFCLSMGYQGDSSGAPSNIEDVFTGIKFKKVSRETKTGLG